MLLKRIMVTALAASGLMLSAPAAVAAEPVYGCQFNALHQADATGQNFEGVMRGYVLDPEARQVAVQCSIEVNGAEVAATPVGTGTAFATTAGRVTYAAAATDSVRRCITIWIFGREVFKICDEATRTQIPPQEVLDALDSVFTEVDALVIRYVDPTLCVGLVAVAGNYDPIVITPEGDVYVNGDFWWNCPPY